MKLLNSTASPEAKTADKNLTEKHEHGSTGVSELHPGCNETVDFQSTQQASQVVRPVNLELR